MGGSTKRRWPRTGVALVAGASAWAVRRRRLRRRIRPAASPELIGSLGEKEHEDLRINAAVKTRVVPELQRSQQDVGPGTQREALPAWSWSVLIILAAGKHTTN